MPRWVSRNRPAANNAAMSGARGRTQRVVTAGRVLVIVVVVTMTSTRAPETTREDVGPDLGRVRVCEVTKTTTAVVDLQCVGPHRRTTTTVAMTRVAGDDLSLRIAVTRGAEADQEIGAVSARGPLHVSRESVKRKTMLLCTPAPARTVATANIGRLLKEDISASLL